VSAQALTVPTWPAVLRYGLHFGCVSFGGPAAQISILYRDLVDEKRWINAQDFAQALNFCMLLPGPEALQLVIYMGWRLRGVCGGLAMGLLFLLPGALLLLALSFGFVIFGAHPAVVVVATGMKAVVVALLMDAVSRFARRTLTTTSFGLVAVGTFIGVALVGLPFPLVVMAIFFVTYVLARPGQQQMHRRSHNIDWRTGAGVLGGGLALWLLPLVFLKSSPGGLLFAQVYHTFSLAAVVTFGGAYSILGYINHELSATLHWISESQVIAGLAVAETTPGPLMLVLQFYGFIIGWNNPGSMAPFSAALLTACLVAWGVFLPSFVLVLFGAPRISQFFGNHRLEYALSMVTASVVGVIASFALTVTSSVLFSAGLVHPDWIQCLIALAALTAIANKVHLGWLWLLAPIAEWLLRGVLHH